MLIFIEILENSMFGRKKEDYPRMGKDKDESKIVFTKDKEIWQENNIENKKLNDNKEGLVCGQPFFCVYK